MNNIEEKLGNNDKVRLKIIREMQKYDIEDLSLMLNVSEMDMERTLKSIGTLNDFKEFEEMMDFIGVVLWHIWALKVIIAHKKSSTKISEEDFLNFIDKLSKNVGHY